MILTGSWNCGPVFGRSTRVGRSRLVTDGIERRLKPILRDFGELAVVPLR